MALTVSYALISASAGYGKTTLLSAWAARAPVPVAWLSLDEQDNDPVRFWHYIIAALRTCSSTVGETAQHLLSMRAGMMAGVAALINDLARLEQDIVLLLDDLHVIELPEIYEQLQFLLTHLPTSFHIILSSRLDPPLGLARLRARGRLSELRDRDLRFGKEETALFLQGTTGDLLSEEEIQLLESRTEGWIAGLHLVALALQHREDHRAFVQHISGNQRFILEYIQDEIFERLPEVLQRFLLQTAILSRLNASLCQAVTGEQNSQQILKELMRRQLFLSEESAWYRVHPLFRDMLLARLQETQAEELARLHLRAAHWYDEQRLLDEAIPHALEGGAGEYAATLIERFIVPQSWRNEYHLLRRWLERLPGEVLEARPDLSFLCAYSTVLTSPREAGLLERVEKYLQRAEQGYTALGKSEGVGAALTLRAVLSCFRGSFFEAFALAERALSPLPEEESQWRGHCLSLKGCEAMLAGQNQRANELLQEGLARCQRSGSLPGSQFTNALSGHVSLSQGALQRAKAFFQQVLASSSGQQELVQRQLMLETGSREIYYERLALYGLAQLAYERNREQEAFRLLHEAEAQELFTWYNLLPAGLLLHVRLVYQQTGERQAQRFLEERAIQQQRPEVAREIAFCRAWLAFQSGDLSSVKRWAEELVRKEAVPVVARHEEEMLLLARLHLKERRPEAALEIVTPCLLEAQRQERRQSELQFLLLAAIAHNENKQAEQAREILLQVCRLARREGYLRSLLDEGEHLEKLLKEVLLALQDRSLAAYIQELLLTLALNKESTTATVLGSALLPHPLTPQEQRVLLLLAQGAGNQQIAEQLIISITTAKEHVLNILSKLGVRNRTQAVARAREYGLLS